VFFTSRIGSLLASDLVNDAAGEAAKTVVRNEAAFNQIAIIYNGRLIERERKTRKKVWLGVSKLHSSPTARAFTATPVDKLIALF